MRELTRRESKPGNAHRAFANFSERLIAVTRYITHLFGRWTAQLTGERVGESSRREPQARCRNLTRTGPPGCLELGLDEGNAPRDWVG